MDDIFYLINIINTEYYLFAVLIFIIIHVIFAIFFIPCSPLTIFAGTLWGPSGVIFTIVASLFSNISTFLLARYFLHEYFLNKFHKNKQYIWLDKMTTKYTWKIVAITQLNPIIPSSTLGYLYGISHIKFKYFILFSFIFSIPLNIAFVLLGSSINKITQGNFVDFIIIMILIIMILYIFKKLQTHIKLKGEKEC
jgi:uncharacterized membrane protein YdjX (TVP38/TMEM64 family)